VVHIQYKNALLPNQHQRCTNKYRHLDNQKHIYASWQHTANNRLWYAIRPKTNVDIAVAACDCVESVIVVQNTKGDVAWGNKDVWYAKIEN
jgi:hypothetical protein